MPIYSIIPKTPAAKGKAKEVPATMPAPRTTRARAAASKDMMPEQQGTAASSKLPQTARKAPSRTKLTEVPENAKQTPMMKRIASLNIMSKNTRTPSSTSQPEVQAGKETMQAFLRIRPPPSSHELPDRVKPYLEMQGDKQVIMRAPQDYTRPNQAPKPTQVYSFNHVFGPGTPQNTFFETTTLPLVEQALQGESGLMFSYGVSNSGKTYTIQGGGDDKTQGADRGMIPRSIDVIFNSIEGMECTIPIKPVRQYGIEIGTRAEDEAMMDGYCTGHHTENYRDETMIKVDRNYSYAVYLSYVEVYNEKIFDLLESVPTKPKEHPNKPPTRPSASANRTSTVMQRSVSQAFGSFGTRMSLAAAANGGNGVIKRQALALKNDMDGGKYVAGLKEIRVRTRDEAHAVFKLGQIDRQVFGTGQNLQSSRSHGIFTIKIVKIHNGAPNDAQSAQVSRLSIVDLAGSERTKNTHNAGERLREAANINTSLMTLGQCMETLRANQALLADKTMHGRRKPAIVPFRHSKLTEMFQGFFAGQGRAVMIVHVNPYDTGFDENSHVMRFSSVAREIQTTAFNKMSMPFMRGIDAFRNAVTPMKVRVPVPVLKPSKLDRASSPVEQFIEEELQVQEVDPEDESDNEEDLLVQFLFDEIKELRVKLVEAEMRNATLEAEIREEASVEMAQTLQKLEVMHAKRLQEQSEASELKTDMKIDIMQRGMNGYHDVEETMDSDSSMLEAAIDQSLMADDENEISGRTASTATDDMNSSRSYTASPTPAPRPPGGPSVTIHRPNLHPNPTDMGEIPASSSVQRQLQESLDRSPLRLGLLCPEEGDVDMGSGTSSRSQQSERATTDPASSRPDLETQQAPLNVRCFRSDANGPEGGVVAITTGIEQNQQGTTSSDHDLDVSPEAEMSADAADDGSSEGEASDEDSEEHSEEDSDEDPDSEEDELDESQQDSSFEADTEVASESSDEEPLPRKPSRRRSSVVPKATPAKERKSVAAETAKGEPAIVETDREEEEEDVVAVVQKSARQSKRGSRTPGVDKLAAKQHAPVDRTPLAETKTQEVVQDTAESELDDEASKSSARQGKSEPLKKKKRKLGKVVVVTEEDIELDTAKLSLKGGGGNVRRMVQRS